MLAGGDHKLIEINQIGFQKILCSYFDFDFFQFYLDNFRRTAGWGTLTEAVYLAFLPTTVFSLKSRCLVIGELGAGWVAAGGCGWLWGLYCLKAAETRAH